MPITLKYGAGYAVAIVMLALLAWAAYGASTRFTRSSEAADRSRTAIEELGNLKSNLLDLETGARGFVITGKPNYLEPYNSALDAIPGRLAAIAAFTASDQVQSQHMAELAEVVNARLNVSKRVIAQRRENGFEAAVAVVDSGEGKRLMDRARSLIEALIGGEKLKLAAGDAATAESFQHLGSISIVGVLAVSGILFIGGFFLMRDMNRRVTQLVEATHIWGAGNLDHRIEPHGNDEIAHVAEALDEMASQLKEHKDALDSFAYTVSHDLRAPLRAMQGFSQALLEDYAEPLGETGRDYAERVVAAGRRMDELIQDLLAYSRLGRSQMDIRSVSLDQIVDGALASLSAVIGDSNATVRVERPLPCVLGHPPVLQQAVVNLISNAVKFVPQGTVPEVRVRAENDGGTVRLCVEDNGIGIDSSHHQRIFNVFERLHGTESYPGTGIGLAIVRKGMERMGGRTGVESTPGHGSRFWIELPQGEKA
jgi:signal transduction histidine kinase